MHAEWTQEDEYTWVFTIQADRFCVIWYVPLSVRFWKWGVANCQSLTSVK